MANEDTTTQEPVEGELVEETTSDTSEDTDESTDPLASPKRDIATIDDLMPEKKSALALWNITEEQMVGWSMEQFVSSAQVARNLNDFSNWVIGRLALGITKNYGADSLGEFANEIGIPKGTVNVYRWVAQKFQDTPDTDLTIMPFSAYMLAASTDTPMDWILRASNENWSVEKLKYEIKQSKSDTEDENAGKPARPKIIKCENCGGYRIINVTDAELCKGHDTDDEGVASAQAELDALDI